MGLKEMRKIPYEKAFTARERMLFLRQLATILRSGLPILQALEILRLRLDKKLQLLCYHLHSLLRHGKSLADAMEEEERFFPPLAIQLVRAGEISGQLNPILEELATYYQEQEELRSFVLKAALYPLFLLAAALGVLLFFLLYVLPILASVYESMQLKPSASMAWLLSVHAWLGEHPLLLFSALLLAAVFLRSKGRKIFLWLFSRGRCGNFYSLLHEVRFCKLLALLLDSGLSITVAVATIAATMEGSKFAPQISLLNTKLLRGADIDASMAKVEGLFSPLTLDLIHVGAATGSLPKMLREAARIGQEDLHAKAEKFKELLAPLLLSVAALLIGSVICAVLGPLLEMLSALPQ